MKCYFCGSEMCWENDFDYEDIFGEGEGLVSYWHCGECGAEVEWSRREDEEE